MMSCSSVATVIWNMARSDYCTRRNANGKQTLNVVSHRNFSFLILCLTGSVQKSKGALDVSCSWSCLMLTWLLGIDWDLLLSYNSKVWSSWLLGIHTLWLLRFFHVTFAPMYQTRSLSLNPQRGLGRSCWGTAPRRSFGHTWWLLDICRGANNWL